VIGIDVNGCSNSQTVSLIVNSNPIATISASGSNTICAGDSLILTANSSNGYLWNNNITTQSISVISSGNYFVTVTDINNCSSTSSIVSVTVNNIPGMPLMSSNSPICEGGTLSFTAVTTPGTIYNWSGPNSFFSILQYPIISNVSNLNNGTYSLNVTYLGCTSPTYTIPAVVNSLPIISINANTTNLCAGQSLSLSANGAATYTWNPGLLSGSNVTVSPTANTTFTVSGSDNFGCGNTQTINMVVNALPNVTIISSSTLICRNSSATLTAGGANSYTWFPNLSNGTNLNVNPSATTIYSLVGTDLNGCVNSESITINVASIPSLSVTVSNSIICEGESTIIIADGASTFSWNPLGSTSNSVIVSPTSNSTYTIFGANGICKDSTTIFIQVNPIPTISIVASNTIICSSSEVSLNAFGALNYTLVPGNIFGNSFTLNPTKSETYSITGTNAQGCNNTQTISVTVNPSPVITIIASSLNICNNKTVTLNVIGANSYSWSPIIDNSSSISISPSVTTTYFVVGTGTNGCLSQEQSVTIKVDFCDIKIYNGITANGDGVNDVFTIDNIQDFPDNHLLIYNRWGQLIYEEHGYDNINKVWPAKENIGKLSTSTYYYIFYPDQKSEPLKGWVELIKD
jgi:gliding motility-associated-like protein